MKEPDVTPEIVREHGLTDEEYVQVRKILGRSPTWTELGIFSAMWSEHCSYKSSRVYFSRLPTTGPRVLQGPGENAGAVDIGDGLAAVFKIESHNHPSFIEPYQGAATGVGGILRDIFTMGARPIALLNSLRFGTLDHPKNRVLFKGVVSGIAGYGNCMGVPTVGGEIAFNDTYSQNCLVNVFCLGVARTDRIYRGFAAGVGNPVLYVGSKTGRDGIHGATMASESFDEKSEEKRPTVQVGDPFTEKLLMEACLELMQHDAIVGIQDMGAAGLTSSSCEMAARAKTGIELDLDLVPLRESGMTPYEIMLSESQERMLIVAKAGREEEVISIFRKWDLDAETVGRVADHGRIVLRMDGRIVGDIPVQPLVDQAPRYERPKRIPGFLDLVQSLQVDALPEPKDYGRTLLDLVASPNIASRRWVYRQFDHMVRTNTIVRPGSDAAVVRIKGTDKALALTVDCNGRYGLLNPYAGAALAVAEAARNLVCTGAVPLALSDCLNFGNPEKPEVMWQFAAAIEGMADACNELGIPVISGNVSFYNETLGSGVYPTPVIGMVGLIEHAEMAATVFFKDPGDVIILLGRTSDDIGGTEYLWTVFHQERGLPPNLDLKLEKRVQECCLKAHAERLLKSAHDCSEGGLAVALAECCVSDEADGLGVDVRVEEADLRADIALFSESASRIVVTAAQADAETILKLAKEMDVPARVLGVVGGDRLKIACGRARIDLPVSVVGEAWRTGLEKRLEEGA